MSRREVRMEPVDYSLPPPSKCAKVLYYTWKLCSVVFSHLVMISLVVAYCILGAVTFEKLEADHEREVKMNISRIRNNTTQSIWSMTKTAPLLRQTNWTADVLNMLKDFENAILLEMKVRGWDGNESTDHIQWTFTGALFYSIIVITTIGYGHIAPKTQTGKVVTIFYAILGIPLMLLCLSNIGDVMASSFRFLYWRVCCYVCTRPPKRRHRSHHISMRRSVRAGSGRGSCKRRRPALEKAHSDTDCRYRDSGYSSGRRRNKPAGTATFPRTRSQPPTHYHNKASKEYESDRSPARYERCERDTYYEEEQEQFPKISLPLQDLEAALKDLESHHLKITSKQDLRSRSLPRPSKPKPDHGPRRNYDDHRYLEDGSRGLYEMHDLHDVDYENFKERKALEERERKRKENEEPLGFRDQGYDPEDDEYDFDNPRNRRTWDGYNRHDRARTENNYRDYDTYDEPKRGRRAKSAVYEYEHRWQDERDRDRGPDRRWEEASRRPPDRRWEYERDVEVGRGRRLRRLQTVDDSRSPQRYYTPSPERGDWSDDAVVSRRSRAPAWSSRQTEVYPAHPENVKEEIKPVPIWLCVFLVASYIVAGTFLFKQWEGWAYLDAAYFCFITLTTIGFGDFVPAQGQSGDAIDAVHSIALCSLYLLFGIALLAMSFNLVQEEVRANVASLATKLGIIKSREVDDSESEY